MSNAKVIALSRNRTEPRGRLGVPDSVALTGLALLAVLLATPAPAQDSTSPVPNAPPADCLVPSQGGQTGTTISPTQLQKGPRNMADCNGVLRPPEVGDQELVEPAPPVGDTPVIRPEDLPPGNAAPEVTPGALPPAVNDGG